MVLFYFWVDVLHIDASFTKSFPAIIHLLIFMNYLQNLNHTFSATGLDKICAFGVDDNIYLAGSYSGFSSIKDLLLGASEQYDVKIDIFYVPVSSNEGYIFFSSMVDYVQIQTNDYQVSLTSYRLLDVDDVIEFDNFEICSEYLNDGNFNTYSSLSYYPYSSNFTNLTRSTIFDLTLFEDNIYSDSGNATGFTDHNSFKIVEGRPSMVDRDIYYRYALRVTGSNLGSLTEFTISYSDNYSSRTASLVDSAINEGYLTGYNDGYSNGFTDGQNSNVDSSVATAFDYLSGTFQATSSIMALEFIPGIPLGMIVSIPLVLVIFSVVFRMIKK